MCWLQLREFVFVVHYWCQSLAHISFIWGFHFMNVARLSMTHTLCNRNNTFTWHWYGHKMCLQTHRIRTCIVSPGLLWHVSQNETRFRIYGLLSLMKFSVKRNSATFTKSSWYNNTKSKKIITRVKRISARNIYSQLIKCSINTIFKFYIRFDFLSTVKSIFLLLFSAIAYHMVPSIMVFIPAKWRTRITYFNIYRKASINVLKLRNLSNIH